MAYRRSRKRYDENHFDSFIEIKARFDSDGIKTGDIIGYNPRTKVTIPTEQWEKWRYEMRSAQAFEDTGFDCSYDF